MGVVQDVELGRLVRQMPINAELKRWPDGHWKAEGDGSVWIGKTPEAVLRKLLEPVESEPVGRDAWTMEGPE